MSSAEGCWAVECGGEEGWSMGWSLGGFYLVLVYFSRSCEAKPATLAQVMLGVIISAHDSDFTHSSRNLKNKRGQCA